MALSTITPAAIPVLIGITACSWLGVILSEYLAWRQNKKNHEELKSIMEALSTPPNAYAVQPCPNTPQSLSQSVSKTVSNNRNDLNDFPTEDNNSPTVF